MKKSSFVITFFYISILFFTSSAAAAILSVGGYNYTDYSSIQDAINNSATGDYILVYPETYTENVNVNKELIIISHSTNPKDTIVEVASTKKHVFTINSDNVTIDSSNDGGSD